MGLNMQNLLSHEWIGLKVTVEQNTDAGARGLTGRVVDETRNMLTIETDGRTLRIAKTHAIFRATLPTGETLLVDGNHLRYRPEDRIKKSLNRW
jgi:ribonuclease P protein subunit POP4